MSSLPIYLIFPDFLPIVMHLHIDRTKPSTCMCQEALAAVPCIERQILNTPIWLRIIMIKKTIIPDHAMGSLYINKYVKARTECDDTETL